MMIVKRTVPVIVALAGAMGAGALSSSARAEGGAEEGRDMAERLCSGCHAISGPGPSPVEQAPPFSGFERKWPVEYLAESLAEGIVTGHGPVQMPVFVFTPEEIDDLLVYLKSVQE
jgi:mono/diheme cytochrome c family protein